jgi:hypothetical protein
VCWLQQQGPCAPVPSVLCYLPHISLAALHVAHVTLFAELLVWVVLWRIPQTCQSAANCGLTFRWATQQEPLLAEMVATTVWAGSVCGFFVAGRGTWVQVRAHYLYCSHVVLMTVATRGMGNGCYNPVCPSVVCSAWQWWAVHCCVGAGM